MKIIRLDRFLENLILFNGEDKTKAIIRDFIEHLKSKNLLSDKFGDMPFENTVSFDEQIEYPGDIGLEAKLDTSTMECPCYCFKS